MKAGRDILPNGRRHRDGAGRRDMPGDTDIQLDDTERVILFSIGSLGGTPLGSKVKLQKIHFLLSKAFPDLGSLFDYHAHLYGPYSDVVETVLEDLISLGLVRRHGSAYELTGEGRRVHDRLRPGKELVQVMEDFKAFLNDLTDNEILTFVYAFYPEYISESAKWDELKGRRADVAASLLRKQKISFSKALELSGLDGERFIALLKSRGVRWRAV
jgi:uncharacterized protein YwgA